MAELPTITACHYASSMMPVGDLVTIQPMAQGFKPMQVWDNLVQDPNSASGTAIRRLPATDDAMVKMLRDQQLHRGEAPVPLRVVQVFIADTTSESIPLEKRVLYKGEPKITDATDQELFFEIDIRSLLGAHNEVRTKTVNKNVKDRTEFLEPARVRDLKMTVVTVATF